MKTEIIGSEGAEFSVQVPRGKIRRFKEIFDAANDEGTIQARAARELFSRPENHITMSLARAMSLAGFNVNCLGN